ncbi:MAG TPA: hypothetical protein VIE46_03605 [Gemmatimonadales bacterium]|jgi:hypothetical protein
MTGIAVLAVAGGLVLPPVWQPGWWLALGITLAIQGPLGWWLMTSLGTERFLVVWVIGILGRLGLVGVTALVVIPALKWPAAPALLALAAFLGASLAVEGIVSTLSHSRARVR